MTAKLLPQDIHLLAIKWQDPDHFPQEENIGPLTWRTRYQQCLENTIAQWLSKGLLAYQNPQRRIDAFVPVSHLIGTSRDSISYIDSLVDIADNLEKIPDPNYRPHTKGLFHEEDFLLLGKSFANGIAKAAEIIARKLGENEFRKEEIFNALLDALTLIQMVKPDNASSVLYSIWSELRHESRNSFQEMKEKYPWAIEHAIVLACYPISNIAVSSEMIAILDDIENAMKYESPPEILKHDLMSCRDAISVGKLSPIDKIPRVIQKPNHDDPRHAWSSYTNIYPVYNYAEASVYAR